jgi:hypothetical protein
MIMYWFATSGIVHCKGNNIKYLAGVKTVEAGTECPITFTFSRTGYLPTNSKP